MEKNMKERFYVEYLTSSKQFGESYIARQTTLDLEKFSKTHKVIHVWKCERATNGSGYRWELKEQLF